MKRLLILSVFLLFFSLFANSQARLGYSESAIRSDFPNQVFYSAITTDGVRYIYTVFYDLQALVGYYFNDEGYCYSVKIIPTTTDALNFYVEYFNNHYVIVSPTEWRLYSNGGIMQVRLVFNDDGSQVFYFTSLLN